MDDQKLRNGRRMLAAAKEKLTVARNLRNNGFHNDSLSRAYYAAFHAVSLLLFLNDQAYSRHGQLIGAFNRDFIVTGKISKELGKALGRLYDQRQSADYDIFDHADEVQADHGIADAAAVIAAVESWCEEEFGITLEE